MAEEIYSPAAVGHVRNEPDQLGYPQCEKELAPIAACRHWREKTGSDVWDHLSSIRSQQRLTRRRRHDRHHRQGRRLRAVPEDLLD